MTDEERPYEYAHPDVWEEVAKLVGAARDLTAAAEALDARVDALEEKVARLEAEAR